MSVFAISSLHTKKLHRVSLQSYGVENRIVSLRSRVFDKDTKGKGKGMESRSRVFHTDQYVRTRMN